MGHGNSGAHTGIPPVLTPPGMRTLSPYPSMPDPRVKSRKTGCACEDDETLDALLREVLHGLRRSQAWEDIRRDVIWRMDIPPQIVPANGTLNNPTLLAAPAGCIWAIHRLTAWGFSAGTITLTIGRAEQVAQWSAPGAAYTYGKGQMDFEESQFLEYTGAGLTGTGYIAGSGLAMKDWFYNEYVR